MTRFPVIALRSVDLGTPDLDRSERFYVSVWGLDVVARHNGAVYLRASGSDHHVLALHHSTRPELHAGGMALSLRGNGATGSSLPGRCGASSNYAEACMPFGQCIGAIHW